MQGVGSQIPPSKDYWRSKKRDYLGLKIKDFWFTSLSFKGTMGEISGLIIKYYYYTL